MHRIGIQTCKHAGRACSSGPAMPLQGEVGGHPEVPLLDTRSRLQKVSNDLPDTALCGVLQPPWGQSLGP